MAMKTIVHKRHDWVLVKHIPKWVPFLIRFNYEGDRKPGFICVHELENGNGICNGSVFELSQAIGQHACVTRYSKGWYAHKRRMHAEYRRRHK